MLLIVIGLVYFWFTLVAGILLVSILRQIRINRAERTFMPVYVRTQPDASHPTLKRITDEIAQVRADQRPNGKFTHLEPADQIVLSIESETEKVGENNANREMQSVIRRYLSKPSQR